jgi:glutamyl-tRNA synthetase
MKITHVIRAEEWISSVPQHLLIYEALGLKVPLYVHLPMILGSDRAKLSKRHGDVSILAYREQGYLPETMFNFLSLMGWSLDDKTELMTRRELVENFSLERIGKTGAIFNREKLDWMNGVYIRNLSPEEFTRRILPFLERDLPPEVKRPLKLDDLKEIIPLIQERAKTLAEVPGMMGFFFVEELDYDPSLLTGKGMTADSARTALEVSLERIEKLDSFTNESLEGLLRPLAVELGMKTGQLFGALRIATTGLTAAPPLFQTMTALGRERCLKRIGAALKKLNN